MCHFLFLSYQIVLKIHDYNKPYIMVAPYGLVVKVNREAQQLGDEIPVINNAQIPRLSWCVSSLFAQEIFLERNMIKYMT